MHGAKAKADMDVVQALILWLEGPCIHQSQRKVTDLFRVNWFPDPKKHLELSLVVVVLAKEQSRLTGILTETQTVLVVELRPFCVILVVVEVGRIHRSRLVHCSVPSTNNVVGPDHSFGVWIQLLYVRLHNSMELSDLGILILV